MENSYKTGNINQRVLYIKSLLITSSSKVVISGMVSIFFITKPRKFSDKPADKPTTRGQQGNQANRKGRYVEVWYQKPYPLDFEALEARESKHGGMQSWR